MNHFDEFKSNFLEDLLQMKAHLGTKHWEKVLASFLLGERNKGFVFDLESTLFCFKRSFQVIQNLRTKNAKILFVNTNPKYAELVRQTAEAMNQAYMNNSWVGGSLTNWKQVSRSVLLFHSFEQKFQNRNETASKKLISVSNLRTYSLAKKKFEGLAPLVKNGNLCLPDFIFVINPYENQLLLQEAKKFQIPVMCFVDTSSKSENFQVVVENFGGNIHHKIDYILPGNSQSLEYMYFCLNLLVIEWKRGEALPHLIHD